MEQNAIINNVEIIGVPEQKNENCVKVVENITIKLNVNLSVINAIRIFWNLVIDPKKINAKLNFLKKSNN